MKRLSAFILSFVVCLVFVPPVFATGSFDISNVVITSGLNIHFNFSTLAGNNIITAVGIVCPGVGWVFTPVTTFIQKGNHLDVTASYNGPSHNSCHVYLYDTQSAYDYTSKQSFSIPASTSNSITNPIPSLEKGAAKFNGSGDEDLKINTSAATFNNGKTPISVSTNPTITELKYPLWSYLSSLFLQFLRKYFPP